MAMFIMFGIEVLTVLGYLAGLAGGLLGGDFRYTLSANIASLFVFSYVVETDIKRPSNWTYLYFGTMSIVSSVNIICNSLFDNEIAFVNRLFGIYFLLAGIIMIGYLEWRKWRK